MIINRGMNSPDIGGGRGGRGGGGGGGGGGGLRILQRYIFRGLSFFEILEGAIFKGAASPRGDLVLFGR